MLGAMGGMLALGAIGLGANLGFGLGEQSYNRWAQLRQWHREDTAVQRKVRDLRAAGLSPTLAAGSAAQSSSPINIGRPQLDTGMMIESMLAGKEMQKKDAEIGLIGAQKDRTTAESKFLNATMEDRTKEQKADTVVKEVAANVALRFGIDNAQAENLTRKMDLAMKSNDLEYAHYMSVPTGHTRTVGTVPNVRIFGLSEGEKASNRAKLKLLNEVTKYLESLSKG